MAFRPGEIKMTCRLIIIEKQKEGEIKKGRLSGGGESGCPWQTPSKAETVYREAVPMKGGKTKKGRGNVHVGQRLGGSGTAIQALKKTQFLRRTRVFGLHYWKERRGEAGKGWQSKKGKRRGVRSRR